MTKLLLIAALLAPWDNEGVWYDAECIGPGGGTFEGPIRLKDNVCLELGDDADVTACFDGSDAIWDYNANGTGQGVVFGLGNTAPPSPDGAIAQFWKSSAGAVSCGGNDLICVESSGTAYLRYLGGVTGFVGFQAGDSAAVTQGAMIYGLSSNATDPDQWRWSAGGNVRFLDMGVGVMEFKQAVTRSTTVGDITDDPAGDLIQRPDTGVATEYDARNGFAKTCTTSEEVLTFSGGAGDANQVTSGLIPDGATDIFVAARVTATGTTCTSADYGDGVDVDAYGDNIAVASGTTMDPSDYTVTLNSNTTAASEVTITGVGGNCVDMVVRVVAHYCTYTAPTD